MTDPLGNRKIRVALGTQLHYYPLLHNSQHSKMFPGPPESLKPDRFFCCPCEQSLFVSYFT